MAGVIKNKYEFVVLFDVENGNPDGDPDASNLSKIDPESGYGTMTDMCLKCKIRNYVGTLKKDEPGHKTYIWGDIPLDKSDNTAYIEPRTGEKGIKGFKRRDPQADQKTRGFMCHNLFDIRAFGVVMITFVKAAPDCGRMRGPIQLGFIRSIDPIVSQEVTITRVAITTERDAENKSTGVGRKNIVPYAPYCAKGYISANLAGKSTGFSEEGLELLWDAITNMFEIDHSTARGKMAVRRLIVFKHSKELGDCPAYKLLDAMEVKKNEEAEYPRKYGDYMVVVHRDQIPVTVGVSEKI